ncbi:hypothetical protein [Nocardia farcinica]|uniref:hypothetical protein n=1 Tax=Nocardia farcinica TaxID=37329 RepID=UPI001895C475|nr:hypothetical protein [Nocardia farcinica]MBF6411186.1 hypothetical protein [Nocardia farcinica]
MTIGRMYPRAMQSLLNGEINVIAHPLRATLHTSSYTPDYDTHRYQSDLTAELPTGGGYTAGGVLLANKSLLYDAATDTAYLDCDDPVWDPATFTARYCVITDVNAGTAATRPLLGIIDFEVNKSPDNGPFRVQIASTGLVRASAVAA